MTNAHQKVLGGIPWTEEKDKHEHEVTKITTGIRAQQMKNKRETPNTKKSATQHKLTVTFQ